MIITCAKATEAAGVLGVELQGLTPDTLKSAYRTACKDCHPDTGSKDITRWSRVSWAKEVLTRWLERALPAPVTSDVEPGDCRACGGTGRVPVSRTSFGKQTTLMCVMCNGSGTPQPGTAFTGRDQ